MNENTANSTKLALMMDIGYLEFPIIYFGKEHIGGYDDLKFYFSMNDLKEKILTNNGFTTSCSYSELESEKIQS